MEANKTQRSKRDEGRSENATSPLQSAGLPFWAQNLSEAVSLEIMSPPWIDKGDNG
jgi:hypothetical protein